MIKPTTSIRIFSELGNKESLYALGFKDLGTIAGMTAGSYIAGKVVEGKDRFMDEVGTSIIWICGVPVFKKIIDKTAYKIAKINPKIDVRLLDNKDIFEKAKKHAPEAIKESFEKVAKNQNLFKGLFFTKLGISTALTLASYFGLTMFRQKHTEKCVMKEIKAEEEQRKINENKTNNPSFGFNMKPVYQFLSNPVQNTQIIDGGISTQRLAESRNIQDFVGYAIREGGFLVSMYLISDMIQSHLEKQAAKKQRPIDLDVKVLANEELKQSFKTGSIKKQLEEFSIKGTDAQIYESLFEKGDNIVVKMAKEAGIITTIKDSEEIDTQAFIDIKKIKGHTKKGIISKKEEYVSGIKEKIENLYKEFKKSGKNADEFFNEVIKMKKGSIAKAIGISMGFLGIIIPGTILISRLTKENNKEFQVKKEIKERMQKGE